MEGKATYPVEIYVREWRIRGGIAPHPSRRFSDVLNDDHEQSFLTLYDASVFLPSALQVIEESRTRMITVSKQEILFAYPLYKEGQPTIPSSDPMMHVRKVPHPVRVYLDYYVLAGNIHLVHEVRLQDALDALRANFLALTDVLVSVPVNAELPPQRLPFLSINKERIVALVPVSNPRAD